MPRLAPALPSPCEVCRQWSGAGLCGPCLARFAPRLPRCLRCAVAMPPTLTGEPAADPADLADPADPPDKASGQVAGARDAATPVCAGCRASPPPWRRAVSAVDYGFPWDTLVAGLKFRNRPELATTLARLLEEAVAAASGRTPGWPEADLVLPVPLAPARLAARGYNQAWELARRVARARGRAADATLLQRPLHTEPLPGQTRDERARSLAGAFMVDPARRADLAGRHVALVDDVLTTGATAREACSTLLRAGAGSVELWTLARTPEPCSTSSSSTPRSPPTPAT